MPAYTQLPESDANGPRGWHVALMTGGTVAAVALLALALAWNSGWGRDATDGRPPPSSRATESLSDAPAELWRTQPVEEPSRDIPLAINAAVTGASSASSSHADGSGARTDAGAMPDADFMLVYIVASEKQAEFVLWAIAEQSRILAERGQREVKAGVLLTNEMTTEVTTEVLPLLPGAPGTRFIDLRAD